MAKPIFYYKRMLKTYTEAMQNTLKELKTMGAVALKAEFEEEAAGYEEVEQIKNLARNTNLKLALKLGGCSAYRDMKDARKLNADIIIAPMIESAYAVKKFIRGAVLYGIEEKELYISIETINALTAIQEITGTEEFPQITGFVFGRTDYTRSKTPSSPAWTEAALSVCDTAEKFGKSVTIGGSIQSGSVDFLKKISSKSFTRFETRKIVFEKNTALLHPDAINRALEFEILWLKSIGETGSERITELQTRLSAGSI